ncbi:hypothetical protein [Hymenobacter sp. HDW8]|uniref:hypothetical protein n=1 Tax=Hymenobacter sp. HDW8 TaxID=2714932 RepID=UPI00140E8D69|nr:hypothetical protein [Hymenobacter sp. HDW8]QIL78300.1 hypothetical protein G7064_20995 [Hymenobacter sp. HDW8]
MHPFLLEENMVFVFWGHVVAAGGILLGILLLVLAINRIQPDPPAKALALVSTLAEVAARPHGPRTLRAWFRYQCQLNFQAGLTPASLEKAGEPGSHRLVEITQALQQAGHQAVLVALLGDALYFIDLWAAHLLLAQARPSEPIRAQCLAVIRAYAAYPQLAALAREQQAWLAQQGEEVVANSTVRSA